MDIDNYDTVWNGDIFPINFDAKYRCSYCGTIVPGLGMRCVKLIKKKHPWSFHNLTKIFLADFTKHDENNQEICNGFGVSVTDH